MNRIVLRLLIALIVVPLSLAAAVATWLGVLSALYFAGSTDAAAFLAPHGGPGAFWLVLVLVIVYSVFAYRLIARKAFADKAVHA
jgi:hypothetical protein